MVGVRPEHDWVVPSGCVGEAQAAGRGQVRGVDELSRLVGALIGADDVFPLCINALGT